jgi:Ca2+-transporting ATPase
MPDGLSSLQAQLALKKSGPNEIDQKEPVSPLRVLLDQFLSPLIIVLGVASVGTFLIGDYLDAGVIFLAILVNTLLGFFQEYKAQNALRALSQVLSPEASVWRDGHVVSIPMTQIVPGDHVVIEAGEQIPADGVFVESGKTFHPE